MKTHTTQVTKSDLLDYVTKFEFHEFRGEMRDFRESVESRFNAVDRRFDQLEESFRVHTGIIVQEFRERTDTIMEYVRHIDAKVDKM